jgi:phosphoserine phosphatase RsbU/P
MSVDGANISANETRIPGAYLVKFPGGTRYALGSSRLTIGRANNADVRLHSPPVARFHAQIEQPKPDQFELTDLRTRSGTYLNGTLIQTPCQLRNGDLIRICDFSFQFVLNSSSPGPISEKSSDGQHN